MRVTVIGSGHGGCAMAAVLAKHGHQVSLLKLSHAIHNENFHTLERTRTIHLSGIEGEGALPLASVTREPAEALRAAELVFVYYVSNHHQAVARACAPHLHTNQAIVLNPGYAGSLIFEREMRAIGNTESPLFAEFETLPYTSRINQPGSVTITSRNVAHPFATYPASRNREVIDRLQPVLGKCVPRHHLLEVALHNPNVIIHTLGVLMNVSLVENPSKSFAMYRDGFSPSMWNMVAALDKEKMDVLEGLGAPRIPYFDEFRLRTFDDLSVDGLAGFKHYAGEAPPGPFTLEHRYITEDVPMGLGLLSSLGHALGIRTPITDSLLNISSSLLKHDFWAEARTLQKLWPGTLKDLLKALTN